MLYNMFNYMCENCYLRVKCHVGCRNFSSARTVSSSAMFRPDLYQKSNSDTKRDASDCLEKFATKLKWVEACRVIDLGSGDGSVTARVLPRFLPQGFAQLVGADIGPEMVAHANARFSDHRTSFIVLDVADEIPTEISHSFDYVFSFYTLHWIQDQQRAFENIYKLLGAAGQCLLLFVQYSPIQDVYLTLARHARWCPYMTHVERYISPYRDLQDPINRVEDIMRKARFKNIHVECEDKEYIYEEHHFRDTMESICPFKIPAGLMDEFMDDYMQVIRDMKRLHTRQDKSIVIMNYTLLAAYGNK